jgi:purine-binding chemotaxis protein CheW
LTGAPGAALLCRARERLCALPIEHLLETMRPLPIEPFPGVPGFVSGLSIVRGTAVPVIDLGALLGSLEPPNATRFVTVKVASRQVSLAVEEVVGICELPGTLSALPPLLGDAAGDAVSAVATLDAGLLLVLQAARLVPDSLWETLGQRSGA